MWFVIWPPQSALSPSRPAQRLKPHFTPAFSTATLLCLNEAQQKRRASIQSGLSCAHLYPSSHKMVVWISGCGFFFFRGKRKKEKKKVGGCWRRIERGFVPCMNFYSSTAANAVIFKLVFSLGGIHTDSARPGASHKAAGLTCNDLVCAAMHIHLLQNDIIIFGVAFRSYREKGARQDTDRQNLFRKYKIC